MLPRKLKKNNEYIEIDSKYSIVNFMSFICHKSANNFLPNSIQSSQWKIKLQRISCENQCNQCRKLRFYQTLFQCLLDAGFNCYYDFIQCANHHACILHISYFIFEVGWCVRLRMTSFAFYVYHDTIRHNHSHNSIIKYYDYDEFCLFY